VFVLVGFTAKVATRVGTRVEVGVALLRGGVGVCVAAATRVATGVEVGVLVGVFFGWTTVQTFFLTLFPWTRLMTNLHFSFF
jgi:hypothetical protein